MPLHPVESDAYEIVENATAATHRPLLAWAFGVIESSDPTYLAQFWRTSQMPPCGEAGGQSLERGWWLDFTRLHIEVRGPDLPDCLRVMWPEVGRVLAAGRVTGALIAECHAAIADRRASIGYADPHWRHIEDRCQRAGLAVWAVCRPSVPGVQLDLFALLETA
jgi:hypothetical protein